MKITEEISKISHVNQWKNCECQNTAEMPRIHFFVTKLSSKRMLSSAVLSASYLPGEENRGVIVAPVPVTGRVVLLLPAAEVPQTERSVGSHFWPLLFLIDDQDLYCHQANWISNAGVFVQPGRHREQGEQVVLKTTAMELCHWLVCHEHSFHITGAGHKSLLSFASSSCKETRAFAQEQSSQE